MPCQEKDLREIGIPIRITSAVTASFIAGKHRKRFWGLLEHYGNCFLSRNGVANWFLRVVRRYPKMLGFD
jgi:hypothetical protein